MPSPRMESFGRVGNEAVRRPPDMKQFRDPKASKVLADSTQISSRGLTGSATWQNLRVDHRSDDGWHRRLHQAATTQAVTLLTLRFVCFLLQQHLSITLAPLSFVHSPN